MSWIAPIADSQYREMNRRSFFFSLFALALCSCIPVYQPAPDIPVISAGRIVDAATQQAGEATAIARATADWRATVDVANLESTQLASRGQATATAQSNRATATALALDTERDIRNAKSTEQMQVWQLAQAQLDATATAEVSKQVATQIAYSDYLELGRREQSAKQNERWWADVFFGIKLALLAVTVVIIFTLWGAGQAAIYWIRCQADIDQARADQERAKAMAELVRKVGNGLFVHINLDTGAPTLIIEPQRQVVAPTQNEETELRQVKQIPRMIEGERRDLDRLTPESRRVADFLRECIEMVGPDSPIIPPASQFKNNGLRQPIVTALCKRKLAHTIRGNGGGTYLIKPIVHIGDLEDAVRAEEIIFDGSDLPPQTTFSED